MPSPTPAPTTLPTTQVQMPTRCWDTLTSTPDEVVVDEGETVGQLNFGTGVLQCKEACDADELCHSFTACPEWRNICWLKNRRVHKGDPYINIGGGCQTYFRVACPAPALRPG